MVSVNQLGRLQTVSPSSNTDYFILGTGGGTSASMCGTIYL